MIEFFAGFLLGVTAFGIGLVVLLLWADGRY